ncbi:hypothetical protein B0H21DRAFT_235068 [Amylocystis lapponica]|nr:hypothetical protein B0H21DRAFT_235068 [Amylocystis lapponica]
MSRKGVSKGDERPRTEALPDGFVPSKPHSKTSVARPQLVSAFGGSPSASRAKPTSVGKVAIPHFELAFDDAASSLPKPPSKVSVRSTDIQRLHGAHQSKKSDYAPAQKPRSLRVQKPPVIAPSPPDAPREQSPTKKLTELSLPRLVLPSHTRDTIEPPSTPPPGRRSVALPHAIADASRAVSANMKTIFTTEFARATDINSEHGPAQLLSIFLQQNQPDFIDPIDRELQRGLGQSPEKAGKPKEAKYRGRWAGFANGLFRRNDRLLTLWRMDIGAQLQQQALHVPPALRLRILSVVQPTAFASHHRSPVVSTTALLHCHVDSKPDEEDVAVLLHFDSTPNPSSILNKAEDLKDGGEIHVWNPWRTLQLSGGPDVVRDPVETVQGEVSLTNMPDRCRSGRVLFCSRFWIVPPAHV